MKALALLGLLLAGCGGVATDYYGPCGHSAECPSFHCAEATRVCTTRYCDSTFTCAGTRPADRAACLGLRPCPRCSVERTCALRCDTDADCRPGTRCATVTDLVDVTAQVEARFCVGL